MLASLRLPPATTKGEVLRKEISETAKKDPATAAELIRTWLPAGDR
jgi:flagellar biosynthesis/type III secretory pathway M-ring protein FliF/YscJ